VLKGEEAEKSEPGRLLVTADGDNAAFLPGPFFEGVFGVLNFEFRVHSEHLSEIII
jgi:hypothetical protein